MLQNDYQGTHTGSYITVPSTLVVNHRLLRYNSASQITRENTNTIKDVEIFDEIDGWSFPEDALMTLGYKMKREDFYTGETIRVEVDPVTGEGKISDV